MNEWQNTKSLCHPVFTDSKQVKPIFYVFSHVPIRRLIELVFKAKTTYQYSKVQTKINNALKSKF